MYHYVCNYYICINISKNQKKTLWNTFRHLNSIFQQPVSSLNFKAVCKRYYYVDVTEILFGVAHVYSKALGAFLWHYLIRILVKVILARNFFMLNIHWHETYHAYRFRPSLSYRLSLRSLLCLFLSGQLTKVLIYITLLVYVQKKTNKTVN